MQTGNTWGCHFDSSMCHFKTPLVGKATGNHLIKFTFLEKTQSPVSGFCYARNRVCNAVFSMKEKLTQKSFGVARCQYQPKTARYSIPIFLCAEPLKYLLNWNATPASRHSIEQLNHLAVLPILRDGEVWYRTQTLATQRWTRQQRKLAAHMVRKETGASKELRVLFGFENQFFS